MHTIIKRLGENESDNTEIFEEAGEIIRTGGLVAFPTETVYGLGGNALDSGASVKIYGAKGRPSDNPLIVHVADISDVEDIAEDIGKSAKRLFDRFWPGPLTVILKKRAGVPYETTGGLDTVAVRMPAHPAALGLIRAAGVPIAAPSANLSGRPSPTAAEHVAEDMDGRIEMIIDGGKVDIGIESTIIDMSGGEPVILRPGYITKEMLEEELGEIAVDRAVLARSADELSRDGYAPKAPGMKYRHYAPKAEMVMFEGDHTRVAQEINRRAAEAIKGGYKAGIICAVESASSYKEPEAAGALVMTAGGRYDGDAIAAGLYNILRAFDAAGTDYIYSESFYDTRLGTAIMNRLIKASGYHIEKV